MKFTGVKPGYNTAASHLAPGEVLHYMKRKHYFVLIMPLLLVLSFLIVSVTLIIGLAIFLQINSALVALSLLSIFLISLSLATKILIDWMFNFYIITTHKISEIRITPLFSDSISEVLLKQVRCTEIDVVNHGIVNQLLNKGDVHVTFDRPTHKDEFVLSDISNPREVGSYLSSVLLDTRIDGNRSFWYRDKFANGKYRFTEEIPMRGGEIL